jgi:hypothetical protein
MSGYMYRTDTEVILTTFLAKIRKLFLPIRKPVVEVYRFLGKRSGPRWRRWQSAPERKADPFAPEGRAVTVIGQSSGGLTLVTPTGIEPVFSP